MKLVGWFLGEKTCRWLPEMQWNITILNHMYPASQKRNIRKQSRPRSDAAERGVWSGTTQFAYRKLYSRKVQNETRHLGAYKWQVESSNWYGWHIPRPIHCLCKTALRGGFSSYYVCHDSDRTIILSPLIQIRLTTTISVCRINHITCFPRQLLRRITITCIWN